MDPLRIACVRYLNTAPLIEGLHKIPELELVPTVPSRIADMVRSGQADVGLVSLVDIARSGDPEAGALALLPVGMIGCDGPTLTVRLYSSIPMSDVETVHVDTDSHTSVILCQVLLARLHGRRPRIVQFDARERIAVSDGLSQPPTSHPVPPVPPVPPATAGPSSLDDAWPQTVLLIGDKVVTDSPPASRYPHQLDLGEAWKQMTGLPFIYAMWACLAQRASSEEIRIASAILDRQLRHNLTRLDWIVARRAGEHRWPAPLASKYLTQLLRYRVGDRERQAVARFLAEAGDLGLLNPAEPLWADALPTAV